MWVLTFMPQGVLTVAAWVLSVQIAVPYTRGDCGHRVAAPLMQPIAWPRVNPTHVILRDPAAPATQVCAIDLRVLDAYQTTLRIPVSAETLGAFPVPTVVPVTAWLVPGQWAIAVVGDATTPLFEISR